jgi:hypothetical protein
MKSFDEVFIFSKNLASTLNLELEIFPNFRNNPGPYQFLTATHTQYWNPDEEALGIANSVDSNLASIYRKKEKPATGYSSLKLYVPLDAIDSRHIMMSTIIFSTLGKKFNNIVEIGAGFGNWVRLNEGIIDFEKWSMIDLGFVSDLQKWYTTKTINDQHKLEFIKADTTELSNFAERTAFIDLVIGAHSLSEFSLEIFEMYFNKIILNSKYLFYATHKSQPSKGLIRAKIQMIEKRFEAIKELPSQNGKVLNILYKRKI